MWQPGKAGICISPTPGLPALRCVLNRWHVCLDPCRSVEESLVKKWLCWFSYKNVSFFNNCKTKAVVTWPCFRAGLFPHLSRAVVYTTRKLALLVRRLQAARQKTADKNRKWNTTSECRGWDVWLVRLTNQWSTVFKLKLLVSDQVVTSMERWSDKQDMLQNGSFGTIHNIWQWKHKQLCNQHNWTEQ